MAHVRYRLSVLEAGSSPILRLVHTPLYLSSEAPEVVGKSTIVFDRLPAHSLHWIPDGIVYEAPEGKRLCRVNGYRWVKSEHAEEMEVDD